jgi:Zn-dependent peptidase ImmA (M78 family)/DNA-binding XRE family transcriptional regulator
VEINREILKLARESRGYNQLELSAKLGIEQGTLSKIENEFLSIDEDFLDKISETLEYPKSFFLQNKPVHLLNGHYRKKITLPTKELKKQLSKMTIVEWHIEKFIESLEVLDINLPSWDCEFDGNPEICANFVREYWKIPRGRLDNLTQVAEANGILIVPMDLGDIDGLSVYNTFGMPMIFINKYVPGDRYRHILAHEIGHLIMHFRQKIDDDRDIEGEAHQFASELLIPSKEIKPHLTKLNIEKLSNLKSYWKVSMAAILVKAHKHLNVITQSQYHYLWKQMSSLGYKKNEPVFIAKESAVLLRNIVDLHINSLGYSISELATLLNTTEKEFNEVYLNTERNLRLVQNKRAS